MNKTIQISLLLGLASLTAIGVTAANRDRATVQQRRAPAVAPVRTGPVRGLVLARPFSLEEPYEHVWRLEKPSVREGWLVVLEVDPSYVEPRQVSTPVLLFGDQTVECVSFGQGSGRVVGIVPGPADLATSSVGFGSPELPERVDAAWIALERSRAEGFVTFTAPEIASARERAGEPLRIKDRVELDQIAALLILEHSPQEHEIAEALLVPVTK